MRYELQYPKQRKKMKNYRSHFIRFYILAILLIGFGFILTLPAFEGFDEYAHYSRIRSSYFDSGGDNRIDKAIVDYEGPWFYSSGNPPFDLGYNYQKFFNQTANSANFMSMYREKPFGIAYYPSDVLNYQNQHPPLYYSFMSHFAKYTSQAPFVDQIDFLRAISYILACLGIFISYKAIVNHLKVKRSYINYGFLVYPLLFPMFYIEFARIGNDSLCLFLSSILLCLTFKWIKEPNNLFYNTSIGLIIGLGLITKALFIPIFAVLSIFFLTNYLNHNHKKNIFQAYPIFLMMITTFCSGGFWYVYNFLANDNYGIGNEMQNTLNWSMLYSKVFYGNHLSDILYDALATLVTFIWAGTQSLVRVNELYYVPLIIFILWFVYLYFKSENNNKYFEFSKLPIWLFIFFYGCLLIHVVVSNLLFSEGSSGGWYMHILMPWFTIAIIKGVSHLKYTNIKYLFFLLFISNLFILNAFFSNLILFSGYSSKTYTKHFEFTAQMLNLETLNSIILRANILNYSTIGIVLFLGGIILYSYIFIRIFRK
jgi:hypothetical protein